MCEILDSKPRHWNLFRTSGRENGTGVGIVEKVSCVNETAYRADHRCQPPIPLCLCQSNVYPLAMQQSTNLGKERKRKRVSVEPVVQHTNNRAAVLLCWTRQGQLSLKGMQG